GFALAWTGLSRGYWTQSGYGWRPVNSGFQQAREAAQRALDLAPDLAEAHAALGLVVESHDWDWKVADRHLQRALALAPGNADVLCGVASLAGILGRADESLELLRRAVALDPLSSTCRRFLGLRCAIYGRLDEAEALRASLDLNPKAGLVHCFWRLHGCSRTTRRKRSSWRSVKSVPISVCWVRRWRCTRSDVLLNRMRR